MTSLTPPLTPEQLEGYVCPSCDQPTRTGGLCSHCANFGKEDVPSLLARIRELSEALHPFAKIEPSSFFSADGSENEGYHAIIVGDGSAEFTGRDLARARSALNRSTDNE